MSKAVSNQSWGVLFSVLLAAFGGGIATIDSADDATMAAATQPGQPSLPQVFYLPDPTLHPGKPDRNLTKTRLCAQGYTTRSVRPSTSYTSRLKALELGDGGDIVAPSGRTYHVTGEHLPGKVSDYELDHLISLQLAGDPEDPKNLWMEPWEKKGARLAEPGYGAEGKDVLEGRLHRAVCDHGMALSSAQRLIATDWTKGLE